MTLYMKLGNTITSTYFLNTGQRLTMRHVVGQIKVKIGPVWVKGSFNCENGAK